MLSHFLEVLIHLALLILVGWFFRLARPFDGLSVLMMGSGLMAVSLLIWRLGALSRANRFQRAKHPHPIKSPQHKVPQRGLGESSSTVSDGAPPLAHLDFLEDEIDSFEARPLGTPRTEAPAIENSSIETPSTEAHQMRPGQQQGGVALPLPFQFVSKPPLKPGQSELQSLDELVYSLNPAGFSRALILTNRMLSRSPHDSLIQRLAEGRSVDSLICRGIYPKVDLVPTLGPLTGASLYTQKRLASLILNWEKEYDLVLCYLEEETQAEVQAIFQEIIRWNREVSAMQNESSFSFVSPHPPGEGLIFKDVPR